MTERSREADEFISSVNTIDPRAVSACEGWTTHEIAAHVTGIAVEVIRHLEPFLQGDPVPETRSFEVREAPLRETEHEVLLRRLDAEEGRMRRLVDDVLARDPDAVIPWTGRKMAVEKFNPHLRNEHALHRWDIVGDDEVSATLLGQFDLVDHCVGELGHVLLVAGREHDPDPDQDFAVRLHSDDQRDLRVLVHRGDAQLAWSQDDEADRADEPVLDIEPGARHVFIWGRRPDSRGRLHSQLSQPELARLQSLLSGY
jgi:Mycothiol maleylpyruvate isomerase N-terminal domain